MCVTSPSSASAPTAIQAIVHELTGGRALPHELQAAIGDRTDGVPLFVEEVTHAVLESGFVEERSGRLVAAGTLPERLVPSTLRESLMARLDGLGEARDVAQVLSVVRREASFELLRVVADLDDAELEAGLDRLVETDLARRRHSLTGESYVLKHWLVQDVAYESLLRSSRRRYHDRIAAALPQELPEIVESQPEFLAYHLIQAGQEAEAITYLVRAGQLAHRRSANTEAIEHLNRALELVRGQPIPNRDRLELTVLIALGAPLTAAKGYSVPEVERIYTRAGELCQVLGDDHTPDFFRALYGTWRVHFMSAAYPRALEFGHQLLDLALQSGNGTQLGAANRALGSTIFYLGDDPAAAHNHLTRVITSKALERNRTSFIDELHDIVDPWITCHAYQAWALWMTGSPVEARQMSNRALTLSKELQHPFTRALAFSFDSWLCQWEGDAQAVGERARDALAVAKEQGFAFWIGWGEIMLGWSEAAHGDTDGGLETMARGLAKWRAVGSELGTTYFFALIADAQLMAGRLDEAGHSLDAADEISARTGEGWWQPEVRRLRGRAALASRGAGRGDRAPAALLTHAGPQSLRLRIVAAHIGHPGHAPGRAGSDQEARDLLRSELTAFDDQAEVIGNPDIPRARALEQSLASSAVPGQTV